MIDLRFQPLNRWIGGKTPSYRRRKAVFSGKYANTLDTLERELRHLGAKNGTVEAGFRLDQIRNDGWPYSAASPADPGVILSFDSKYGSLALPCDHFLNWQQNLRAIALHLEHLRLATLYGVGAQGEQYRGWKSLPAPGGENSLEEFAARIIRLSRLTGYTEGRVLTDCDTFRFLYRAAAKHAHSDTQTGATPAARACNAVVWYELQEAERIIAQVFKAKGAGQ